MNNNQYNYDPQVFTAFSGSTVTSYARIDGASFVSVQIYKSLTGTFIENPVFQTSNAETLAKLPFSGSTEGAYWVTQGISGTQTLLTSSGAPASVTFQNTNPICSTWARISFNVYATDVFKVYWNSRN